jgi:hypothetical protein
MSWWNPFTWGSASIGDPYQPLARTVATYGVVMDKPLTLAVGADIDRTFEFTLRAVDEGHSVIVSFLLVSTNNLQLQITLNDMSYTYAYSAGPERVVHEVIGAAAREGDNQLTVRVNQGSCRFSDMILWYGTLVR